LFARKKHRAQLERKKRGMTCRMLGGVQTVMTVDLGGKEKAYSFRSKKKK